MDRFGIVFLLIFGLGNAAEYQLPTPPACGVMDGDLTEGNTVGLHEFPWIVWLSYGNTTRGSISCAGVLISPRHMLTAAHCIESHRYSLFFSPSLFFGEHNLATNPDCEDDNCNPGVDGSYYQNAFKPSDNDNNRNVITGNVAVLRLGRDVEMSQSVRPICLPKAVENLTSPSSSDILYISGWAKDDEKRWGATVKTKRALRAKNKRACSSTFPTSFCVKPETEVDGCYGFLGSPLMKKVGDYWVMEGLFNNQLKCNDPSGTFIVSKISEYEDWIDSVLDKGF